MMRSLNFKLANISGSSLAALKLKRLSILL